MILNISQNIEIRLGDGEKSEGIKLVFSPGSVGDEAPKRVIATLKPVSDMSLPEIILRENELVSIGTRKDNTVMLRNNHISAQHCFLRAHSNGTIILEDNGSTNGTYVVGVEDRIIKLEIYKGQKIYLATQEITFEVL